MAYGTVASFVLQICPYVLLGNKNTLQKLCSYTQATQFHMLHLTPTLAQYTRMGDLGSVLGLTWGGCG